MKFKLASPSATMNIGLSREELFELLRKGFITTDKQSRAELYHTMFEENDSPFIQFLNIYTEEYEQKIDNLPWHPCSYVNGKLQHDGSWKPGYWYEWIDRFDNRVHARLKDDAEDHFWPNTEIKEEDIIAFREIKGVSYEEDFRLNQN